MIGYAFCPPPLYEKRSFSKLFAALATNPKLIVIFFFVFLLLPAFVLAPTVAWTSDSDWSGGTFGNTTSINGDLMLNNTIVNGTQMIYS